MEGVVFFGVPVVVFNFRAFIPESDPVLYTLYMPPAKAFDLTAKLKISLDLHVI